MATQAIDLSAGLVPQSGGVDISAGLVPTQFAPPPGTPSVPRPQINMQEESLPEALGGNELESAANSAGDYADQVANRVRNNLQSAADQVGKLGTGGLMDAMDVRQPHSVEALKSNLKASLPNPQDYNTAQKAAVNIPADVATGALFDTEGKVPEAGREAVSGIEQAAREASASKVARSVRAAMPAETSGLPSTAIQGAEDVIRAAAPVGTNTRFRANVYAAAGDLAEIGRDVRGRLAQAKGGIVQPDMRARVTVDAINDHLADMYQNERAAQIARNPRVPVPLEMSEDLRNGLSVMARSGDAATRAIAKKAMSGGLTLGEADQLARDVNSMLQKFEAATPQTQAAMQVMSRGAAGLKVADQALGRAIDDELMAQGQPGVASYERRYAALSAIRSQLEKRVNMAELQHPGAVKAAGRAVKQIFSSSNGLAGASQAAVADVSTGKALERGLGRLADSGIRANRAMPQPRPGGEPSAPLPPSKPPMPERRGGGETGPRAQLFSDEERAAKVRAEMDRVSRGGHNNPLLGNPFDRNPDFNETAVRGARAILEGHQ